MKNIKLSQFFSKLNWSSFSDKFIDALLKSYCQHHYFLGNNPFYIDFINKIAPLVDNNKSRSELKLYISTDSPSFNFKEIENKYNLPVDDSGYGYNWLEEIIKFYENSSTKKNFSERINEVFNFENKYAKVKEFISKLPEDKKVLGNIVTGWDMSPDDMIKVINNLDKIFIKSKVDKGYIIYLLDGDAQDQVLGTKSNKGIPVYHRYDICMDSIGHDDPLNTDGEVIAIKDDESKAIDYFNKLSYNTANGIFKETRGKIIK